MADYYQLKNQNIFNPPANTSLGNTSNQFANAFVQNDLILGNVTVTGSTINTPKVSTIGYPGNDTAADTAGGQTITLTGSGFLAGASVLINGSAVSVVTVVSTTSITFTSPANNTGSYVLYVINTDGGTAIAIPGIQYSGVPTWTTAAGSLGSVYETASFNQTVTATGDAPITYSLFSGSIPPGSTFNSNGTITGTSQVLSSPTTYTFTVRATDAEAQDTNRSFSLTITPDVVTWVSPANGTTYTTAINSAISNVVLSATSAVGSGITYTANALPTGLSLAGANISGTPTVEANSSSLLTATANTTSELSSITINWVISVANDVYFEYNTLLIPGASTTFVDDASTNNFAVTIFGDTKPNNSNPYTPGYYSNYFDGTGDYISVPDNVVFTMGAGDFTLEAWVYLTTSGVSRVIIGTCDAGGSQGSMSYTLSVNASNNAYFAVGYGGAMYGSTNTTTILTNQWVHIAGVRSGANIYVYLNGVQSTSNTNMGALAITDSSQIIGIGRNGAYNGEYVTGYISNTRIVKGLAVYTGAFTVPTSPLQATQSSGTNIAAITGTSTSLLTCQSNRFIDNSTTPFTVTVAGNTTVNSFQPFTPDSSYSTYGSGYFDGTGDYLTAPSNAAFALPSDFTIEFWLYQTATTGEGTAVYNPTSSGINLFTSLSGNWGIARSGVAVDNNFGTPPIFNTWNHIAVSRSGSTLKAFINGVQVFSGTNSVSYVAGALQIGYSGFGTITGYISNFRVVKGTALYTANFTPPTTPLTAVANTSLLTLQNNQSVNNSVFLDNSSNNFLVTRAGNTTQGTFSPYGGNWSNYFNGSSGLSCNVSGISAGTSTFTFEAWVFLTAMTGDSILFDTRQSNGASTTGMDVAVYSNGTIKFYDGTENNLGGTVTANVWTHIALVRNSSNVVTAYINGTATGTTVSSTRNFSDNYFWIASVPGPAAPYFNGYMSNLRWVVGTAVYTSAFTPSTTPLTAITNTKLLTCQSNRIVDNSINNYTITPSSSTISVQRFSPFNPSSLTPTSYSGYFDGTGDYLTVPITTNATADLTFECWFYATGYGSLDYGTIIGAGSGAGTFNLQLYNAANPNRILGYVGSLAGVGNLSPTLSQPVLNRWIHLAVVRSGSTFTMYENGVSVATATNSNSMNFGTVTQLGAAGSSYTFQGYISNLRLVIGTAVYTSNFTPSTTPLTAISGTSLLTLQSTTFIDNSTNNFTITAFGNTQPLTQNPFGFTSATTNGYTPSTIGGSGYYDGSGDSIASPQSATFNLSSGNWTCEAWYYSFSILGQSARYMTFTPSAGAVFGVLPGGNSGATFTLNQFGSSSPITSSIAVTLYAWQHIALVKSGSTTTLYINGVAGGSATVSWVNADTTIFFGGNTGSYAYDYSGYISDGRFVKGTALYTSNFVPPSLPLTAVQNTSFLLNYTSGGIIDYTMMNNMETVADTKLSTAISKFGGSSVYFDGSGDRLSTSPGVINSLGSGDFTIEGWVYPLSLSSMRILSQGTSTTGEFLFILNSNGSADFCEATLSRLAFSAGSFVVGEWKHFAIVRSGSGSNNLKGYINGTLAGTGTSSSYNFSATTAIFVGSNPSTASQDFQGYIDDLRITKGYARYTANFSAPTSAFPIF